MEDEKNLIEGVKEFLKMNLDNPKFKWFFGSKEYDAKKLLEEIDKNKALRAFIIKKVAKFATEQLTKGVK